METNRRNFLIRGIGAAICAGLTPPLITSLLPLPDLGWRVTGIDKKAGAITLEMIQNAMNYARDKAGIPGEPLIVSPSQYLILGKEVEKFLLGEKITLYGAS